MVGKAAVPQNPCSRAGELGSGNWMLDYFGWPKFCRGYKQRRQYTTDASSLIGNPLIRLVHTHINLDTDFWRLTMSTFGKADRFPTPKVKSYLAVRSKTQVYTSTPSNIPGDSIPPSTPSDSEQSPLSVKDFHQDCGHTPHPRKSTPPYQVRNSARSPLGCADYNRWRWWKSLRFENMSLFSEKDWDWRIGLSRIWEWN